MGRGHCPTLTSDWAMFLQCSRLTEDRAENRGVLQAGSDTSCSVILLHNTNIYIYIYCKSYVMNMLPRCTAAMTCGTENHLFGLTC